ncbi:hypothetical protein [Mycobacterium sp. D16Q16]|uniref:hypothetical protein n=1 Tax=Mycobacterium sp. D16Q16 TaxID=1855659 RepID=UPI0015920EDD|nr:hypothetical protein [Mycobacterium sp. D16Q16]
MQTVHRGADDIESELSLLRTVREVLASRGAPDPGPTALEATLQHELKRLQGPVEDR